MAGLSQLRYTLPTVATHTINTIPDIDLAPIEQNLGRSTVDGHDTIQSSTFIPRPLTEIYGNVLINPDEQQDFCVGDTVLVCTDTKMTSVMSPPVASIITIPTLNSILGRQYENFWKAFAKAGPSINPEKTFLSLAMEYFSDDTKIKEIIATFNPRTTIPDDIDKQTNKKLSSNSDYLYIRAYIPRLISFMETVFKIQKENEKVLELTNLEIQKIDFIKDGDLSLTEKYKDKDTSGDSYYYMALLLNEPLRNSIKLAIEGSEGFEITDDDTEDNKKEKIILAIKSIDAIINKEVAEYTDLITKKSIGGPGIQDGPLQDIFLLLQSRIRDTLDAEAMRASRDALFRYNPDAKDAKPDMIKATTEADALFKSLDKNYQTHISDTTGVINNPSAQSDVPKEWSDVFDPKYDINTLENFSHLSQILGFYNTIDQNLDNLSRKLQKQPIQNAGSDQQLSTIYQSVLSYLPSEENVQKMLCFVCDPTNQKSNNYSPQTLITNYITQQLKKDLQSACISETTKAEDPTLKSITLQICSHYFTKPSFKITIDAADTNAINCLSRIDAIINQDVSHLDERKKTYKQMSEKIIKDSLTHSTNPLFIAVDATYQLEREKIKDIDDTAADDALKKKQIEKWNKMKLDDIYSLIFQELFRHPFTDTHTPQTKATTNITDTDSKLAISKAIVLTDFRHIFKGAVKRLLYFGSLRLCSFIVRNLHLFSGIYACIIKKQYAYCGVISTLDGKIRTQTFPSTNHLLSSSTILNIVKRTASKPVRNIWQARPHSLVNIYELKRDYISSGDELNLSLTRISYTKKNPDGTYKKIYGQYVIMPTILAYRQNSNLHHGSTDVAYPEGCDKYDYLSIDGTYKKRCDWISVGQYVGGSACITDNKTPEMIDRALGLPAENFIDKKESNNKSNEYATNITSSNLLKNRFGLAQPVIIY